MAGPQLPAEQHATYSTEIERLRAELDERTEELSQAGAALRAQHCEIVKLRNEETPITRRVRFAEICLRSWLANTDHSQFADALTRFIQRQKCSIKKRLAKLSGHLEKGTPQSANSSFAKPGDPPILFDERYYKSQSRTKRRRKSWWSDYQEVGWKEGLNPHPLFDVQWYLETNPDIKATGEEPLGHFLNRGWKEGRNPNAYFQTDWYIAHNQEILNLNINPLLHYLQVGWKNERDPGPKFSFRRYFNSNPHADKAVEPFSEWMDEIADGKPLDNKREYFRWPTTYIPSDIDATPVQDFGKIAVQLHAFYVDKLDIILDHLKYIPVRFDLLVSTDTEEHAREIEEIVAKSKIDCALDIRCSQNRGRDVAPLICLFGRKLLDYDYALHIHTKKSLNVKSDADHGHDWLMHNLGFLACNEEYVKGIFSLFHNHPKCGVIAPKPWKRIRQVMMWTSNRSHAETLIERLHLPKATLKTQPLMFPGGTMFWFRPAALKPLLASDLQFDDFPPEPIPNDGTLAHAIERCILYIALSQGYHSLIIAPSLYKPAS